MKQKRSPRLAGPFLFLCLGFFACFPQPAAGQDAAPPANPARQQIDEKAAVEALASPVLVTQFDLRKITGRTPSFTQEEVRQAKDIVLARLKEEGIDTYEPSLRLVDSQEKTLVVFVALFEDRELENGEMLARTYHIQHGTLIRVIKRYPDGSSMTIRTGFTNEEIEKATAIISEYLRNEQGWSDEEYTITLYAYAPPAAELHMLEFEAIHKDDLVAPAAPGGGKSLFVKMNMNTWKIVQVLHFQ